MLERWGGLQSLDARSLLFVGGRASILVVPFDTIEKTLVVSFEVSCISPELFLQVVVIYNRAHGSASIERIPQELMTYDIRAKGR